MPVQFRIPVRRLVEFLLRSGSIDQRFGNTGNMAEGSRIHRKLQKAGGHRYVSEVPVSYKAEFDTYCLTVEGRIDGIITDDTGCVTLEEIKTTGSAMDDPCEMHRAQAICYGYMYSHQNHISHMVIRLTYFHISTGEVRSFDRDYDIDELGSFFLSLIERYRRWIDSMRQWIETRDASILPLLFPYASYRPGQREMAASVQNAISKNRRLFCQAPTGTGKTVSVLFPAVKSFPEGRTDKIFYLTSKNTSGQSAENALTLMRLSGLKLRSVTLTAKDKICILENRICSPEVCARANGHYDRINDALYNILQKEEVFTRSTIESYSRMFRVCPFELSLDLTLWSDCIISDYNYVFDPRASLKRFFTEQSGNYIFLIDEAHNLADRAREMFSAELVKSAFLAVYRQLDKKVPLRKSVYMINRALVMHRKECEGKIICKRKQYDADFHKLLLSFVTDFEQWIRAQTRCLPDEKLLSLYFDVLSYLKISEIYNECYITLAETRKGDVRLRLFCIDPSALLSAVMEKGISSILFSATLIPMDYYSSVLGGEGISSLLLLPSPFPKENLCLLVADGISTRLKDREGSRDAVAAYIAAATGEKAGNYIVYFPSYVYMKNVHDAFRSLFPGPETVMQHKNMTEEEREAFLRRFRADNPETLIGFCVMGGIYSESIDLSGDRLIGTVIVGVGLPLISPERDIIRDCFESKKHMGFAYAYRFPGMAKVLQAAGRVIRSETDRGIVVLIDDRFAEPAYTRLFPDHWKSCRRVRDARELRNEARAFWTGDDAYA